MRHISLDLMRVTEAAAIHASKWVGSGNKELADKAATDAMRKRLNDMAFAAKIIIGEGEKDESYGLFAGEVVGALKQEPDYEIAVDPIEGTTPTVNSGPEAISCLALAHKGCMYPAKDFYMLKLAYGRNIKEKVTLSVSDPIETTIEKVSTATGKPFDRLMVCVLNRPRHKDVIKKLREMNVRIKLIQDCDVSGSIATCRQHSGVDLMYGIGGAPEAVLSAAAIKCLGGDFQGMEVKGDKESNVWTPYGPVLGVEDLAKGHCIFVATGITNGSILEGVRLEHGRLVTNSVFMRSESGTVRWVQTEHGN